MPHEGMKEADMPTSGGRGQLQCREETAAASPRGTWLWLTAERRWSEGGFQLVEVHVCVRVLVSVDTDELPP